MRKAKPPGYWTPERVKEKVNKHKTLKGFFTKDFDAYSAASRLKIFKEVTKNLSREQFSAGHWTKKTVKEAIKDFETFKQWQEKDKKSYAAATRLKLLNNEDVVGHLIKVKGQPISKWSKKAVLEDALLDDSRSAWKLRSPGAYRASRDRGYFEEAVKHMTLVGNKYKRCIYSIEIKDENKIYIGLSQHFKTRMNVHLKSERFKKYKQEELIMTQLTDYIDREKAAQLEGNLIKQKEDEGYNLLNKDRGGGLGGAILEWTKDKVLESAKKEQHKVRWKENEPGAYHAARKGEYLEEAVAHMEVLNPKGKWSEKEDVLADAKQYDYRYEWQDASVGAYEAAKNNEWFEEAVAHMPRRGPNKKK
jgi:predicted GIY-YIG superfamily endonuclease